MFDSDISFQSKVADRRRLLGNAYVKTETGIVEEDEMPQLTACTLLAQGKCAVKRICLTHTLDKEENGTEDGF